MEVRPLKYNFIFLCSVLRFLQIASSISTMVLIFLESGNLSYLRFGVYMLICVLFTYHVMRKWIFNIDGRYDLQRLLTEDQTTSRLQYSVSVLTACLLSWLMWNTIQLENSFSQLVTGLSGAVCVLSSHLLLGLEFYEVLRNNK